MSDDHFATPEVEPEVSQAIQEAVKELGFKYHQLFEALEARIESLEMIIAAMTTGYTDVASLLQGIASWIERTADEESKQLLVDDVADAKKTIVEVLQTSNDNPES